MVRETDRTCGRLPTQKNKDGVNFWTEFIEEETHKMAEGVGQI